MKRTTNTFQLRNIFLFATLALVLIMSISFPVFAKSYVLTWDLVDSGKHLDYDGNSVFMAYIVSGVVAWEGYKGGIIRPDNGLIIEDVYISDVNSANGWAAMTYSNGKIEMNSYYLNTLNPMQKVNISTHELGHALGLAHSTTTDVMDEHIFQHTSAQSLSQNDKDSYDAAYRKY